MRIEDWPARLAAAIETARNKPFVWGRHDCGLFMADCCLAMTGADPAAAFRGRPVAAPPVNNFRCHKWQPAYRTRRGAAGALKRYAGGGLAQAMERSFADLGWPEIAPGFAQRGDAVLFAALDIETALDAQAAGICTGAMLCFAGPAGLDFAPMSAALRAWKVG